MPLMPYDLLEMVEEKEIVVSNGVYLLSNSLVIKFS